MKVGDLVSYIGADHMQQPHLGPGLVTGFDVDGDPIVLFAGDREPEGFGGSAYLLQTIEVINASG